MNNKFADSKNAAVGWVRMQKNRQTNEFFFVISLADGTKGTLKLDSKKIQGVKQDESLINKQVVGTILVKKGEGGTLESAALSKQGGTTEAGPSTAPKRAVSTPKAAAPVADFDF